MNIPEIKTFLQILGFFPKNGETEVFSKLYKNHGNYEITIVLKKSLSDSKIDWGNKIKVVRSTSSNLSNPENLVVLECVDRLLNIGYRAEKIVLEKQWKLGHKGKGFLDIQVLDNDNNSFLLIECKTWGKEYEKEKNNTLKDGGQLFSYFIQEKQTQYLSLYSSFEEDGKITFKSDIIVVNDQICIAQNQKEAFEAWNPQVFEKRGLFEISEIPYKVKFLGITKADLKPLTAHDGGNIFNRFAEILRKNVVSDKTNAFNKIFNLFLCKIVDEDKRQDSDEVKFQWKQNEKNEEVLLRLNDLYKEGMKEYLDLDISAVSEKELEDSLSRVDSEEGKDLVKKLFIQQKLYSGNEFAFKEVFDKDSFEKNCIVVKEVVKLLEEYQIKYQHKQQFLGDFFEKLLNTGIKQEAGQFFTPIPLTAFICKSLPIRKIIEEKNNNGAIDFLPYVIDFASGSGHFLTEMMSEIEAHVLKIDKTPTNWIKGGREAEKKFNAHKSDYYWAKEYIYGIEKDYRLAKTTKISTFLNGDGDANVICADGLDSFELSKDYKGKLKATLDGKTNHQFDILIANPPYSVSGFKTTINYGKQSFDLFKYLTDKSSEIECLFIERMDQLLTANGVAGIILPTSILNGGKIHRKAREIILRNFTIKGIVEVGGNAFMEAGIKTAILFLQKRSIAYSEQANRAVDNFFRDFKDFAWNKKEKVISKYVQASFGESVSFESYIDLLNGNITDSLNESELGEWYINTFGEKDKSKILSKEKERLFYFLLTFNDPIVLVKSGEKQEEKDFLGYEFSNRKGSEGIKIYETNQLFNPENLQDQTKVNSYILNNFLNKIDQKVDGSLKKHVSIKQLHKLIDFKDAEFDVKITTKQVEDIELNSAWPLRPLKSLVSEPESGSRPKGGVARIKEGIPSIGGEHISSTGKVIFEKNKKFIPIDFYEQAKQGHIRKYDILICKDGALTGKVAFVDEQFSLQESLANEHVFIIRSNEQEVKQKYLFEFLLTEIGQKILRSKTTGSAQGGLNKSSLKSIKVPAPDISTQEKMLKEIHEIEQKGINWKEDMLKTKKQELVYKYLRPEIKIVSEE